MSESIRISLRIPEVQTTSADQNPELVSLIQACISNDRSAQEVLYKRYSGKMMGLCMRYVKNYDDAMEILNFGFLKVFKSLGNYQFNGSFEGWIYRIVYNSIIDSLRTKAKAIKTEEFSDNEMDHPIESNSLHKLYASDLIKLLDQLPDSTRIVFNMFAIEGYKHDEIASMLNISTGTSKWHVSHARETLKTLIETQYRS